MTSPVCHRWPRKKQFWWVQSVLLHKTRFGYRFMKLAHQRRANEAGIWSPGVFSLTGLDIWKQVLSLSHDREDRPWLYLSDQQGGGGRGLLSND